MVKRQTEANKKVTRKGSSMYRIWGEWQSPGSPICDQAKTGAIKLLLFQLVRNDLVLQFSLSRRSSEGLQGEGKRRSRSGTQEGKEAGRDQSHNLYLNMFYKHWFHMKMTATAWWRAGEGEGIWGNTLLASRDCSTITAEIDCVGIPFLPQQSLTINPITWSNLSTSPCFKTGTGGINVLCHFMFH